ncbi:hypothetical protein [Dactylosporangium matsuzakiense]|uniref:Uncharacterized protein n=1 Tax=Dactylosporangium matsuzakiense TaxID=53360 RepID=A0A9W6NPJ5_9ACTN|nr:hypothetical protein [Dactylosporangium matsuzakiense]UWZ43538.1 hypothetical protein Dmats_39795 [Dactylosporangium matsuzakiense]GLL04137.1 hypothetical protein GCM10017581_058840 [Dactylosporangium matsuzakiense]
MTTPADLAHEVLLRVAAFVKSLPADQLADLASGEAKLELVPKAGRSPRPPRQPAAGAALSRPVTEIQDMLSQLETRQAATQYLNDLKLTVPQLKELAKVLGIPAPAKSTKTTLTTTIVDTTTGRRADSLALSAP